MDTTWTRLNWVFLDQISGTSTGWLVVFSGGSFGGEIQSRRLRQRPGSSCQLTRRAEFTRPRGAARKNSLMLAAKPEPNRGMSKAVGVPAWILAGRSARKSLRFERRLLMLDSLET